MSNKQSRSNTPMRQNGVYVEGSNFVMDNCEMSRFPQALTMDKASAQNTRVRRSYFYENWRTGSSYGVRATGGASVDVQFSEFRGQRHAVVGNSRDTYMYVANNYFVNDDREQGAYEVDMHPQGTESARMVIRDNVFRNVAAITVMAGSTEITGNYFDQYVDDWNPPIIIKPGFSPTHIPSALPHDIYVGENDDQTGAQLVTVTAGNYGGTTKWGAYNVFTNGELWEASHTRYPARGANPRPFVGNAWLSEAGGPRRVINPEPGTWYDLHLMAVDPQGASDITEVGVQIVDTQKYAHRADHQNATFHADGDYYIQTTSNGVRVRETEGSADWSGVDGQNAYVDTGSTGHFSWQPAGAHRTHVTVRFRLPQTAADSAGWRIFAYAEDAAGHRPRPAWNDARQGWRLAVGEASGEDGGDPIDNPPVDPPDDRLTLTAARTDDTIVVDGLLDEPAYAQATPLGFTDADNVSDNTVSARAVWSGTHLVVSMSVDDSTLVDDDTLPLHRVDGAELFLDTAHNRSSDTDADDFHWVLTMAGDGAHDDSMQGGDTDLAWEYAVSRRTDGFDVEFALAWDDIGVTPAVDWRMGLLLANNDRDGDTTQQFSFNGAKPFHTPSQWGDLRLAGASDTPGAPDAGIGADTGGDAAGPDAAGAYAPDSGAGNSAHSQRSSEGCSSAPGSPAGSGWVALLALVMLGGVRRRQMLL